jgi:hypothetical protein
MRIGFYVLLLVALCARTTSAFGQSSEHNDPFRVPTAAVSRCDVLEKGELLTNGVGFRFDLEDESDQIANDRTVDAEFDSSGIPLVLVIVTADSRDGSELSPRIIVLRFEPTGNISILDLRQKRDTQAGGPEARSGSAEPAANALSPEAASKAKGFATWLWSQRCPVTSAK